MKTLLHHKTKDLYFKGVSERTGSVDAAFDFGMTERVARFVRDAKLPQNEMEVVLTFGSPSFNVTIPMDERFKRIPQLT
jgi:hypothetical protein